MCYSCQSNSVEFAIIHSMSCGFAVKIIVKCISCGMVKLEEYKNNEVKIM